MNKNEHFRATDKSGQFWGQAGAGALFYSKSTGRFCLNHRSSYVNEPDHFGTWGGAIDNGEEPIEAMMREVNEETQFSSFDIDFEIKLCHLFEKDDFKYYNYLIITESEFTPVLNWEAQGYIWAEIKDFPEMLHFGLKAFHHKLSEMIKDL